MCFRRVPGLALVIASVAVAAAEPPRAVAFGAVLKIEESPSSRVLYFKESGGLVKPVAAPPPESGRQPLPPLPAGKAKAPPARAPIAREDPGRITRLER